MKQDFYRGKKVLRTMIYDIFFIFQNICFHNVGPSESITEKRAITIITVVPNFTVSEQHTRELSVSILKIIFLLWFWFLSETIKISRICTNLNVFF